MEWAAKGNAALTASDANEALQCYTRALIAHPQSPDYFTKRATSFTRLKPTARNDLALQDAEFAILLGRKRANREKIQAGQQRRVVALYGLGRYADAKYVLESMKKWRRTGDGGKSDQMEHDMWMSKIEKKLVDAAVEEAKKSTTMTSEYPTRDLPDEKTAKAWLERQLQTNNFELALSDVAKDVGARVNVINEDDDDSEVKAAVEQTTSQAATTLGPIRQDFYQNNDNLIVTVYAKKVDATKFLCSIEPHAVQFSFPRPDDASVQFRYSANPLHAEINPANSKSKVFGTKVELTLAKVEKGVKWPSLEATDRPAVTTLPNPYASKDNTDWNKKAAELTKKQSTKGKETTDGGKEDEGGSDADSDFGGDQVDGFFKKLYAGADEDTRRAMMKSFTESNGTALSTNWADVGKGKVEEVKSKAGD